MSIMFDSDSGKVALFGHGNGGNDVGTSKLICTTK